MSSARGFLGAGDLYIARQVGGVFQAYEGPFECTKFEIKPNSEIKERVSKGKSTYGQVVETVAIPQPADLTIDLAEVNTASLALALLGTTSALAQSSGTLTAEAIVAVHDKWVPLSKIQLTGAQTVTHTSGTPTYVEGVDYLVNKTLGWIKALSTGDIANSESIKVTSTYAAVAGIDIAGATQAQIRAKFKLDGKNFADEAGVIVTVHEGVIASDSALDFLADDFATVSLPGRMKTPTGFNAPFNVHLLNP
jgi:hypothetical protein